MSQRQILLIIYFTYLAFFSLVTFALYGSDKTRAEKQKQRVRESTLLLLSFIGGAFGGAIAMKKFRHKTKHWYFRFINGISIFLHVALFLCVAFVFNIN